MENSTSDQGRQVSGDSVSQVGGGVSGIWSARATEQRDVTESKLQISLLERYVYALMNHKLVVSGVIAGAVILAILATILATPLYTATARIEISQTSLIKTEVGETRDENVRNELSFYQSQYSLLEARSVAERVARDQQLVGNAQFNEMFNLSADEDDGNSRESLGRMSGANRERMMDRVVSVLMDNVTISPVRGSSLVDVQFTSPDPQMSARIANAWVQQFIIATLDRRMGATTDARKFLEQRLATLRASLEDSERSLVTYASNADIVTLSQQTDQEGRTRNERTLVTNDIEAISSALNEAIAQRIEAQSNLGSSAVVSAESSTTIAGLRQRRAESAAALAKLSEQFGSEYPSVIALRSELANIDRSIATEIARTNRTAQQAYNAASKQEATLRAELTSLRGRYTSQQRDSIQLAILQREVDTNRQLYDGLLQRYKEIGAAGVGTNNISIVDTALAPRTPSSPRLLLNIIIALVLGITLSVLLIFLLEQTDQSIRDPADVSKQLGLPLLGSIPLVDTDDVLDEIGDKKSALYEAYLALSTNLSFLTVHGSPRSLMFTSARPNEGKTSSAISLAKVFAGTGRSTVLIDADMRNPSVGKGLGLSRSKGLSHYLAGDDDLDAMILDGGHPMLKIVAAGPIPPNAAELLSSNRFNALIARLLERFDQVVVDSPPVLGLADAPLLARMVEGVVFTIEANSGKIRAIKPALDRLEMSGGKIFGAVVTKIDKRNQAYGYGYGYGPGYGYGYGNSKQDADEAEKAEKA